MSQTLRSAAGTSFTSRARAATESKAAHDYFADTRRRRRGGGAKATAHRLRALVRSRQHRGRSRHPLRRLPDRLPAALPVLPQPRHLAQVQRPPGHGGARDAADRQVRAGAQDQQGRHHASPAASPLVQRAVRDAASSGAARSSGCTPASTRQAAWATRLTRPGPDGHRSQHPRHQVRRSRTPTRKSRASRCSRRSITHAGCRRWAGRCGSATCSCRA